MRFKTVLLDPPWLERGGGKIKRGADRHYPLMETRHMPKLIADTDEWRNIEPSAHLWMWATDNYLEDALWLIKQLGFRYIRTIVWVKMIEVRLDGMPGVIDTLSVARSTIQIGLGQYARGAHELMLFATRGKAMVPTPENRPPSVIFAPRTKHSQKPDESYELIERVSSGPYLEYFARRGRSNWTTWGNEAPEAA